MDRPPARPARALAWAGVAGPALFGSAAVVAPFLQPRYRWRQEDLSALFAQDAAHPWVMVSGVIGLGTGTVALAVGLRDGLGRGEAADIGRVLLAGLGAVICVAAVFRNDCSTETAACAARVRAGQVSWHHHVHDAASGLIFVLLLASPLVLAHAFRPDPRWRGGYGWSIVTGVLGLALLVTYLVTPVGAGVLQRLAIGLPVLWLAIVSWRLARIP